MGIHVHHLRGCRTTPLAHYLKALGVLRLVAQQADPQARGAWRNGVFVLLSSLNEQELLEFFLNRYSPTPLVAPWNGGSGFYPKDNHSGFDAISESTASRFETYRQAIVESRQIVGERDVRPSGEEKENMLQKCRQQWDGPLGDWLDAVVTLSEEGSPAYPALLGTGGNDGRLDFTNNFMQQLTKLFDLTSAQGAAQPASEGFLRGALLGEIESGLDSSAVGQFFPGAAGGANGTTGFSADTNINSWDFVLTLEGAIVLVSSVTRRALANSLPQAAAPFAVRSAPAGYGSAADENSRGEQWMPLWENFASFEEIHGLIAEARCQTDRKIATRPLETARAIARLGVARGISAFQRYGYIERNGLSNLAVPLGVWHVREQPNQNLLDEIVPWYERLESKAADKNAPASISQATRRIQDAMLDCCREGDVPMRWLQLLLRLGEAEEQLVRSPQFTGSRGIQPLRGLSAEWLIAETALPMRPEFRIALAIAGQHAMSVDGKYFDRSNPIRRHWIPLQANTKGGILPAHRFHVLHERLAFGPDQVCHGRNLSDDLIQLIKRRMLESKRDGNPYLALCPAPGTGALLSDIQAWLQGDVDQRLVSKLVRPLMALDWSTAKFTADATNQREIAEQLSIYATLKLCYAPGPLQLKRESNTEISVKLDPLPLARLNAGDLAGAMRLATQRLKASGIHPYVSTAVGNSTMARRIASSLAIPIDTRSLDALVWTIGHATIEPDPLEDESDVA
ncbi:type I-U CRISPR-associated protein Csx17 [bacterium]|nr:type I-U CRISPR-associated protein Csx17 [bacterium]